MMRVLMRDRRIKNISQLFPLILISNSAVVSHNNQYQFSTLIHTSKSTNSLMIILIFYSLLSLSLSLSPISISIPFQILRRIILFYSQKNSSSLLLFCFLFVFFLFFWLMMELNKCQSDDREMNTKVTKL